MLRFVPLGRTGVVVRWCFRSILAAKAISGQSETLEELYGDTAEVHAAELAHHYAEAEAVLGTDKLACYSLLAGEKALATYAYEEAQSHFEIGLQSRGVPLEGMDPAQDSEGAALLFGYGRCRTSTGQRPQMKDMCINSTRSSKLFPG